MQCSLLNKNYVQKLKENNTLTGPANCKNTTKFWQFQGQISPNRNFFWKIGFIQIEGHI